MDIMLCVFSFYLSLGLSVHFLLNVLYLVILCAIRSTVEQLQQELGSFESVCSFNFCQMDTKLNGQQQVILQNKQWSHALAKQQVQFLFVISSQINSRRLKESARERDRERKTALVSVLHSIGP